MNAPLTPADLGDILDIMSEQTEDDRDEQLQKMFATAWPTPEAQDS